MWRLLTFPLVTVAAITGHAFAGGMVLALCCDFRVMTSGKGLLCMNEVTPLPLLYHETRDRRLTGKISFSSPLPNSFAAFLRLRIPHPPHLRDTLLGRRWTQAQALDAGIIDEIVEATGAEAVVSRAVEIGQREGVKAAPGPWGMIKVSPCPLDFCHPCSGVRLSAGWGISRCTGRFEVRTTGPLPSPGGRGFLQAYTGRRGKSKAIAAPARRQTAGHLCFEDVCCICYLRSAAQNLFKPSVTDFTSRGSSYAG